MKGYLQDAAVKKPVGNKAAQAVSGADRAKQATQANDRIKQASADRRGVAQKNEAVRKRTAQQGWDQRRSVVSQSQHDYNTGKQSHPGDMGYQKTSESMSRKTQMGKSLNPAYDAERKRIANKGK
jgi:hypothetical protein